MLSDVGLAYPRRHFEHRKIYRKKFIGNWYYVWIMARSPSMPEADYQYLLRLLANEGYDIDQIQRVPQRWPSPAGQALRQNAGSGRHG